MHKDLAYYLSLNYPIELTREEGIFVASHPDLPGCVSQGETADEAIFNLDDARATWLSVRLDDKLVIPEPIDEELSGRITLRMMPSLHAQLAQIAARRDLSLNLLINTVLAQYAGGATYVDEMGKIAEDLRVIVTDMRSIPSPPVARRSFLDQASQDAALSSRRSGDILQFNRAAGVST